MAKDSCLPKSGAIVTEHLHLDRDLDVYVHQDLVNQLADHQLEGVRFLYNQLREYTGIFLNDETGLGKCHQVLAFLSATTRSGGRSIVVCSSRKRIDHWAYHLDNLSLPEAFASSRVLLGTRQELLTKEWRSGSWDYVVVDETDCFMTAADLESLRMLTTEKLIFVSSVDLLDELMVLSDRLPFCCETSTSSLRDCIERQRKRKTKANRFKIYLWTRSFLLRRQAMSYRKVLPMIEKTEFEKRFHAWTVARTVDDTLPVDTDQEGTAHDEGNTVADTPLLKEDNKTMTPALLSSTHQNIVELGDSEAEAPLQQTDSEPLFEPFETDTEQMPMLRVESDSPVEHSSTPGESEIPETAPDSEDYLPFGQDILDANTSTQPVELADDRYRFPMEKFNGSQRPSKSCAFTPSVESLPNAQQQQAPTEVIVVSSSAESVRHPKSPSLFGDTDNDTASIDSSDDELTLADILAKSPGNIVPGRSEKATTKPSLALRHQLSCSTPIEKLIRGPLHHRTTVSPENVSSADMFADSLVADSTTGAADNVFEITKNNAFANRLVVHEDAVRGGIPTLRFEGDTSDDEVQFIDVAHNQLIDLDSETPGTPKTFNKSRNKLEALRTPQTGPRASGSPVSSGWLGKNLRKSSESSGSTTPTSSKQSPQAGQSGSNRRTASMGRDPTKRRRKLDDLFQTVDHRRVMETERTGPEQHRSPRGSDRKGR
ncbi:uncharacterized protein LOC131205826 [Anopheles bellator]|uniref:uncharacterized protein LOC131205826 n=1 Tax=Anopheles bellator TaxID=139047 RepID=UPI002647C7AA|nr:uncharacterized protein LOC131205826 [Anopheles bellator]